MRTTLLLFSVLLICSCSKNKEHCWDIFDALGNQIKKECGKTEKEIAEQYGIYYDRSDAPKYCWKVVYPGNGPFGYAENVSEKMIGIYSSGALNKEKVACGYCQNWMSRQKNLYKPTGNFAYSPAHVERYCGDTCATIFAGRILTLRETADSLITLEFVQKL